MGCHAGLNILQVASNWALANPGLNAVMCSVEICSAEYVWNKTADAALQMKLAVTNSLFGDGCTAAVVCVIASFIYWKHSHLMHPACTPRMFLTC